MGNVCETILLGRRKKKKSDNNQENSKNINNNPNNSNIDFYNNITNDAICGDNNKNSKITINENFSSIIDIINNTNSMKIINEKIFMNNINMSTDEVMNLNSKKTIINNSGGNSDREILYSSRNTTYIINHNLKNAFASTNNNINNSTNKSDTEIIEDQLKGSIKTKEVSPPTTKTRKLETYLNFKEKYIPLIDGEKAGCGHYSINTFCLFISNKNETFLVYSVENSNENKIIIYALNMINEEKKILYEKFEDRTENITKLKRRRIPTHFKYYNIEENEYIIAGFEDSCIYIWELKNSEFEKIKVIENNGNPINGICLFKNKINNELIIFFIEYKKQKIYIMNLNEYKTNINILKYIYFLDLLEKDNKLYIIAGLLNKVISFEFEEKPSNYKIYINDKNFKRNSYKKGHECVIIYRSNENENDIKLIDSDTEGKCINIFNFESTELLLILGLINCKPFGINIWNRKFIIVSCLEFIENLDNNNTIIIIKINLNKNSYNQKYVDLLKNEGAEEKIVASLKGHKNGTISTCNMKNQTGEFFVSIGKDQSLKIWKNYVESALDIPLDYS